MSDPDAMRNWLQLLRARIGQRAGHKKYSPSKTDAISQCAFAKKLGVTCATMKRWECLRDDKPRSARPTYPHPFWVRVLTTLAADYGMPPPPPRPVASKRWAAYNTGTAEEVSGPLSPNALEERPR